MNLIARQSDQPFDHRIMAARADEAADLLKVVANGQRLRILCLLSAGELSVGEINQNVELSQSALSQHLARLREEGVVQTRREAQTIYYRLTEGPVTHLIAALYGIFCAGDPA